MTGKFVPGCGNARFNSVVAAGCGLPTLFPQTPQSFCGAPARPAGTRLKADHSLR